MLKLQNHGCEAFTATERRCNLYDLRDVAGEPFGIEITANGYEVCHKDRPGFCPFPAASEWINAKRLLELVTFPGCDRRGTGLT